MDSLHTLTQWFAANPNWGIFFAFVVAFTESLAIVGSIVPGSVTLTAVGVLIGAGILPFHLTLASAILGAVLGDTVSYGLGYYFKSRIRSLWPFKTRPYLLEKGEEFFMRHGGKSIFLGRFIGFTRAILPLVIGTLNFPFWRFLWLDIISGILWAPAYMLPGIVVGAATTEMSPEDATRLVFFAFGLVIAAWLATWLIKITGNKLKAMWDKQLDRVWFFLQRHPRTYKLTHWLADPNHPSHHGQLSLAISAVLLTLLWCALTYSVIHQGFATYLDQSARHFSFAIRMPWLDKLMVLGTIIASKPMTLVLASGLLLFFILRREHRAAMHWFAGNFIANLWAFLAKISIHSPRPSGIVYVKTSMSYPSGHAVRITIECVLLAVFLSRCLDQKWRKVLVWTTVILLILSPVSRVYLNAHWFRDIISGVLLALIVAIITTISWHRRPLKPRSPRPFLMAIVCMVTVGMGLSLYLEFNKLLQGSKPLKPHSLLQQGLGWEEMLRYFKR